jgi:hypothetical protein
LVVAPAIARPARQVTDAPLTDAPRRGMIAEVRRTLGEMPMRRFALLLAVLSLTWSSVVATADEAKQPLRVLYVGAAKKERAAEFEKLLRKHFAEVKMADRVGFDTRAAKDADVVVFDWSQSDSKLESTEVPFGRLEDWTKPTVLLNHAGLLVAQRWQVIGGAG